MTTLSMRRPSGREKRSHSYAELRREIVDGALPLQMRRAACCTFWVCPSKNSCLVGELG